MIRCQELVTGTGSLGEKEFPNLWQSQINSSTFSDKKEKGYRVDWRQQWLLEKSHTFDEKGIFKLG